MVSGTDMEQFIQFVEKAHSLRHTAAVSSERELLASFNSFVERSSALLVGPIQDRIGILQHQLAPLRAIALREDLDILKVAGLSFSEDAYTELISWMLDPKVHPVLALALQRSWLSTLGIAEESTILEAVTPRTQFWTNDGIPDLVLSYPEFLVVTEAKTGSEEHTTPRSNKYQTEAYPAAVKEAIGLGDEHTSFVIYLTVDRSAPVNNDAIPTTYLEFAIVAAEVLDRLNIGDPTRTLCATILTHLATCAIPNGVDISALLADLGSLTGNSSDRTAVLRHLSSLLSITSLLQEASCQ